MCNNLKNKFLESLKLVDLQNTSAFLGGDYSEMLEFMIKVYVQMFNEYPFILELNNPKIWTYDVNSNENIFIDSKEEEEDSEEDDAKFYLETVYRSRNDGDLDLERTINSIIEEYQSEIYIYNYLNTCFLIGSNFIIVEDKLLINTIDLPERLLKCIQEEKPDNEPTIKWVLASTVGFTVRNTKIKKVEFDPDNYNDDLPIDKINEHIKSKSSSLMIFHGIPGSGKTTFIRSLIVDNPKIPFYWLDSSMFSQIVNADFVRFLIDHKGGVFVLEDCESLLMDRGITGNGLLSTLLNISDGMLGDSLNIKFICTFNNDLTTIDKALFRKGRLKIKYEFKELAKDKVNKLFKKLNIDTYYNKEMVLCDIYNYAEDNGSKNLQRKRIGFSN